jgi:hypothetical protein
LVRDDDLLDYPYSSPPSTQGEQPEHLKKL